MAKQRTARPFRVRKWFAILAVVLLVGLFAGCSGSSSTSSSASSADASSESASASASAASVASEPVSSSVASTSSEAAVASLNDAELTASTKYLEYSNKTTDPLKLVTCSIKDAMVTTHDTIDLSKVGNQTITYQISAGGQSVDKAVEFMVRDTKAPTIRFVTPELEVEQGEEVDILSNIESVSDDIDGPLEFTEEAPSPSSDKAGLEEVYAAGWYVVEEPASYEIPRAYPVIVTASDKHGNVATKEFSVVVKQAAPAAAAATEADSAKPTYVLNTNPQRLRFHRFDCRYVKDINPENYKETTKTREELMAEGYTPCGHCNP